MTTKAKTVRKLHVHDAAEDAQIAAGIAADHDAPELGDEFFTAARPASEVLGVTTLQALKRSRGHLHGSVAESTKHKVNLRLAPDAVEALRASGDGWETPLNTIFV